MRLLAILLTVKAKLLARHWTRKGRLVGTLFLLVYYPLFAWITYQFVRDAISQRSFLTPDWVVFLGASIASVAWLLMVIVGELQFSFVLNLAQRTTDNEFLLSLPIRLEIVVLLKSLERLLSDFTLPMALGAAVGFVVAFGGGPAPIAVTILSVLASSLVVGILLFIAHLILFRWLSPHQMRQLSLLIQPFAVAPLLFLPLIGEGYVDVVKWINEAGKHLSVIQYFPPYAFARAVASWSAGGSSSVYYPLGCLAVVLILAHAALTAMERAGWTLLPEAGGGKSSAGTWPRSRLLRGFHWKDAKLLVRDQNLLGNAFLLPMLLIAYWLLVMGDAIRSSPQVATLAFVGFVFYFNGFGAMNAVGSEGGAIATVRTMPVSTLRFLGQKSLFWTIFSAAAFLPLFLGVARWFSLPIREVGRGFLWVGLSCPVLSTLGVALSAIFAQYDAKVLQQASTLGGKGLFFLLSGMFIHLAAIDSTELQVRGLLFFGGLVVSLFLVASRTVESQTDPEFHPQGRLYVTDGIAILFGLNLLEGPLVTLFRNVPATAEPTLAMSTAFLIVGPIAWRLAWTYIGRRTGNARAAVGLVRGRIAFSPLLGLAGAVAYFLWIEGFYRAVLWKWPHLDSAVEHARTMWSVHLAGGEAPALVVGFVLFVFSPLVEETLFRGIIFTGFRQYGFTRFGAIAATALLFAAVHPPIDALGIIPLGLFLTWLYDRSGSLAAPMLAHALANIAVVMRGCWPQ